MIKVGLTGGIACGKSVVRRRIEERGIPTLDADQVVHALLGAGSEVVSEIAEVFGESILSPDGSVDRKALGAIVFADEGARARLNAIVHPRVHREIEAFFEKTSSEGSRVAVVDAALMVETGSFRRYDRVIVAHCPRDQQRERLMRRDGISREDAERRISAQMPIEEKRRYADFLVDTSGTMAETLARTDAVVDELLRIA
jgi:dephospho-CoA kinase